MNPRHRVAFLIGESYVVRYLLSGFFVTTYSLILLTLLGRFNFYIAYVFVEFSSNLIRCRLFERFVFVRSDGSIFVRLKRYGIASLPVVVVNYMTYFLFPVNPLIASLRAVIISIFLGFILARKVYN